FTRDDIANYIAELKLTPQKTFFEPCSNLDIIRRVLRNLVNAYGKAGEQLKKEEVMELMEIINEP
ncbi:MAG: transglutaminase-like domain-containing protein, partial [Cyclobacteriaceae bacterium]|nr:transglutaminase-like domain-containing protein [Cyclobacteriaceae bacterium]